MRSQRARKIALMGLLMALSIALSYLESLVPAIPGMVPGIKLGLSNIATMYCLFFLGVVPAALIVLVKSAFALLVRGVASGLFSFCGGVLSVVVMALLVRLNKKRERVSKAIVSVGGAVFHNMGQLLAASLFLSTSIVWYYAPVLVISGVFMGLITAAILRAVEPSLFRLNR